MLRAFLDGYRKSGAPASLSVAVGRMIGSLVGTAVHTLVVLLVLKCLGYLP